MPELRELTLDLCACKRTAAPDQVARALLACPGVERAHVDAYVTWALAAFDASRTSPALLVKHLAAAGFEVSVTRLFDPEPFARPHHPAADPAAAQHRPPVPPESIQEPA